MIRRVWDEGSHGIPGLDRGAGHQQRVSASDDAFGHRGDLRRRFAKPKNNFRKTLPMVPMGVHAREAKVLERRRGQCIANACGGGIGIECASAHLIEHLSQVGFSHGK